MKLDRHFFEILRTRMENILRALSGNRKAYIIFGDRIATDIKNTVTLNPRDSIIPGVKASLAELYLFYKACTAHEGAHIRYTSLTAWKKACKKGPIFQHLTNIIEDGRIEAVISEVLPGAGRWLKFNNHYIFNHRKDYGTGSQAFLGGLVAYSVVGQIPKVDPKTTRLIRLAAPHVDIGKAAASTEEVLDVVEEILKIPEIKELLESMPPDPIEGDKGTLSPEKTTPSEKTKSRAEKALTIISKRKSDKKPDKPAGESGKESEDKVGELDKFGESGGKSSRSHTTDETETYPSKTSSDKLLADESSSEEPSKELDESPEEPSKDSKESDEKPFPEDSKESDEPSEDTLSDSGSESDSGPEDKDTPGETLSESAEEPIEEPEEEPSEATDEEETSDHSEEKPSEESDESSEEEDEFFTAEVPKDDFEDLLEKAKEELDIISGDIKELKESDREIDPAKEKNITGIHTKVIYTEITLPPSNKYHTLKKANQIITQKLIEEIRIALETKKAYDIRGLHRGRLHTGSLYKLAIPDPTVFTKRTIPGDIPELAVFVLVDLSGSMGAGTRMESAKNATCVLSETCRALKITHKISGFFAAPRLLSVYHQKAVDWDSEDSSPIGHFDAKYENRDGYSIRIATNELLMRPEPKKVLFMLSDGAPLHGGTSYRLRLGLDDTKQAALEAKKKGVNLISLFFGSSDELPEFMYMYENPVYVDDLNMLPIRLGEVFKRVLLN